MFNLTSEYWKEWRVWRQSIRYDIFFRNYSDDEIDGFSGFATRRELVCKWISQHIPERIKNWYEDRLTMKFQLGRMNAEQRRVYKLQRKMMKRAAHQFRNHPYIQAIRRELIDRD